MPNLNAGNMNKTLTRPDTRESTVVLYHTIVNGVVYSFMLSGAEK
jgi:hypothetical protein